MSRLTLKSTVGISQSRFLVRALSTGTGRDKKEHFPFKDLTEKKNEPVEKTTFEVVGRDVGLSEFVKRVYLTTGVGITGSLGTAWGLALFGLAEQFPIELMGGGFVAAIAGCIGMGYTKYEVNRDKTQSENSQGRLMSFGAITAGMSMSIAPVIPIFHEIDPMILPTATLLSLGTMGAATFYAYSRPPGALMSWQTPLMVGLGGLCGVSLTALGSMYFYGPNPFSEMLHTVDVYGGIVFFSVFTAYETQAAVAMYQKGDPDHLGCAVNLYLDFMNLLIRFAEALAKAKR
jgi:FtsH-binding integral membrane protein